MTSEHSVMYGDPGGDHRIVTREVFEVPNRILGTETTEERWFEGQWSGWKWRKSVTETRHFHTRTEAGEWVDDMFRQHQLAGVRASIERARAAWARTQDQLSLEV